MSLRAGSSKKLTAVEGIEPVKMPSNDESRVGDIQPSDLVDAIDSLGGKVGAGDHGAFALAMAKVLGEHASILIVDDPRLHFSVAVAVGYAGDVYDSTGLQSTSMGDIMRDAREGEPGLTEQLATGLTEKDINRILLRSGAREERGPAYFEVLLGRALGDLIPAAEQTRREQDLAKSIPAARGSSFGLRSESHENTSNRVAAEGLRALGFELDIRSDGYFVKYKGEGIGGAGVMKNSYGARGRNGAMKDGDLCQNRFCAVETAMKSKQFQKILEG